MDQNQQNRVVGRGALIKKILEEKGKSNVDNCGQLSDNNKCNENRTFFTNDSGATSGTDSRSSVTRPLGRGKMLEIAHRSQPQERMQQSTGAEPCFSGRQKMFKLMEETAKVVDILDDGIMNLSLFSTGKSEPVNKMGTKGTPIDLVTNYMKLNSDPDKGVYEYAVSFKPDLHSLELRRKLFNQQKSFMGINTFDGVILYLPKKLHNDNVELISINENMEYKLSIIFRRKKSMGDPSCVHLYNVLFDRIMKKLEFVRIGRKKFDPTAPKIIPQHKLEIWPGYVTAVDEYEGGVMLNLDVSHRVLCQTTVLDTLTRIFRSNKEQLHQLAFESLIGNIVLTRYNNRTYRIDDIDWDSNPRSTFIFQGENMSYIEYYKLHYNIYILDEKQPLLISRLDRKINGRSEKETVTLMLIPEICYLTGITDEMRYDQKVMRDIATITRVTPEQRHNAYRKFCENVNNCKEAKEILFNWGLTLEGAPLKVLGRRLGNETIKFGDGRYTEVADGDFSKFASKNTMLTVIDLNNWLIIHTKRDDRPTRSFIELMRRNAKPMGMNVTMPRIECLPEDKTALYVKVLRKSINPSLQIIVIICPSNRDDRYAAIKKVCCTELPIPTQVINGRSLSNEAKNRTIAQKIALQMNCKLGGSLWAISIPLTNVMICGIDAYHDCVRRSDSVTAFISSLNPTFTRWFSHATIQSEKEEISNGLCYSMTAALAAYKKANDCLPDKIIIFRDGVSHNQINMIKEYEIPQVKDAFGKHDPGYTPGLTVIVVQKRIHTRFFTNFNGKLENPKPGSIVDHTITNRFLFDFFLVAQNALHGTVSPTHYIVVYDSSDYSPDIIQRLSYKLCFLYYNWPGTVRVPACCQYAHKLAQLVGQSIKRQPAEALCDKLYFL